jgi:hypothetical protein
MACPQSTEPAYYPLVRAVRREPLKICIEIAGS